MSKLKRLAAYALSSVMVSGLVLSGCGGGKDAAKKSSAKTEKTAEKKTDSKSGSEKQKLTIAIGANSFVTDYKDNYFTHYLEDKLNVYLDFYQMPGETEEFKTKLSLMVTNGKDMPDIVIGGLQPETILDYGSKGAFIPLNDYIKDKKKSPNFNKIPKDDKKVIMDTITNADGKIYSLPKYEPETWNLTPYRMYINGVWLKKLGLKSPTTTDELEDVLQAFHDKDPNGNGQQDELGVYGYMAGGYGEAVPWALMNSFVFYNGGLQNGGLSLDEKGKKVIAPFTTDGWQDGLKYMNELYKKGLLSASIFTDDDTQFKATLNSETNVNGFVSCGSGSSWGDWNTNKNFQELDIISPLKGPDGIAYTPYSAYTPENIFFITSACKNPDLAFKLGDEMLNVETGKVARFGEKGVDWTDDPAVCAKTSTTFVDAGLYDKVSMAYLTNIWAEQQNKHWRNVNPRYASMDQGNTVGNAMVDYDPNLKTNKIGAYSYEHYYSAHPKKVLPLLHYTLDEASQVTDPLANIPDYIKQTTAEFVIGQRDIDKDWDAYIQELDSMGLKQWLKCAQKAYDRMEE